MRPPSRKRAAFAAVAATAAVAAIAVAAIAAFTVAAFTVTAITSVAPASAAPEPTSPASAPPSSILAAANLVRTRGCDGRAGLPSAFERVRRLNAAARNLASGASLGEAIARAGYPALRSASIRISGNLAPRAVEPLLASRFCQLLTSPALRDVGLYRRGRELWIIAAEPFAAPALADAASARRQVLWLVNQARAHARRCGTQEFASAGPLMASRRLRRAALRHSRDMAAHGFFSHRGSDGSTPGERVTRAGYPWSAVGENIAAGQTSAEQVVAAWLASPAHCANLMEPSFTQTGIAYVVAPSSKAGVYWTEDFARPLRKPPRRR